MSKAFTTAAASSNWGDCLSSIPFIRSLILVRSWSCINCYKELRRFAHLRAQSQLTRQLLVLELQELDTKLLLDEYINILHGNAAYLWFRGWTGQGKWHDLAILCLIDWSAVGVSMAHARTFRLRWIKYRGVLRCEFGPSLGRRVRRIRLPLLLH